MRFLAALPLFLLSGCAVFGGNPALNADQLKAIAADNKNSVACISFPMMGGVSKAVIVNIDETRSIDGSVSVEGNCDKLTVNTSTVIPPPKVVVPKTP